MIINNDDDDNYNNNNSNSSSSSSDDNNNNDDDNNNSNNNSRIEGRNSKFFMISLRRELSQTRSLKCANHVQHIDRLSRATCSVPLGTKGQLSN